MPHRNGQDAVRPVGMEQISQDAGLSSGAGKTAIGNVRGTVQLSGLSSEDVLPERTLSGMDELDRVLGGGLVAASAILWVGIPVLENQRCSCRPPRVLRKMV